MIRLIVNLGVSAVVYENSDKYTRAEAIGEAVRLAKEGFWDGIHFYPPHRIQAVSISSTDTLSA